MKFIIKLFLIVLFFQFFGISSTFANNKELLAAADPWPPYVDPNKTTNGINLEIIRAALKNSGYSVKMVFVPWARALAGIKNGVYDVLPDAWMLEDLKKELVFSDPIVFNELKFVKRKNDSFEYKNLESLKGKTIGTVINYGYEDSFNKSDLFIRKETRDFVLNVRQLVANRIDLTIEDELVATTRLEREEPKLLSKISFTKEKLANIPMFLAVGVKHPHGKEIIKAFNSGLLLIKKNGIYDQIFASYGIKKINTN